MARLEGRIAIVTGAASGLGQGIARRFVREGATVVMTDIDPAGAAEAEAAGAQALFLTHDVSREADWQAVMATVESRFGRLDILVNCAGVTLMGSVEDVSLEAFDRTWAINTRGALLGCRGAIALMKRSDGGAIINIASVSSFKPMAELVAYNASKAALALMSQSIALHCAKSGYGIRCNTISPGVIRTAMLEKVIAQVDDGEALMAGYKAMHPIGRIGEPEDIASMAVFLASDESRFVTGVNYAVDGGLGID